MTLKERAQAIAEEWYNVDFHGPNNSAGDEAVEILSARITRVLEQVTAEEREYCAQIAESLDLIIELDGKPDAPEIATQIAVAKAIRGQG